MIIGLNLVDTDGSNDGNLNAYQDGKKKSFVCSVLTSSFAEDTYPLRYKHVLEVKLVSVLLNSVLSSWLQAPKLDIARR